MKPLHMTTRRLERATELIRRELSSFIVKNLDIGGAFITLTRVELSRDLQYADVYLMVIPDARIEEIISFLKKNIFSVQQELNKRLRMRPVPKVRFHKDEAELEAEKLNELLKEV